MFEYESIYFMASHTLHQFDQSNKLDLSKGLIDQISIFPKRINDDILKLSQNWNIRGIQYTRSYDDECGYPVDIWAILVHLQKKQSGKTEQIRIKYEYEGWTHPYYNAHIIR